MALRAATSTTPFELASALQHHADQQILAHLHAQATALRWYEPLVVPGLLQTDDYARAILSARPDGNLDDLDDQVAARLLISVQRRAEGGKIDLVGRPPRVSAADKGVQRR